MCLKRTNSGARHESAGLLSLLLILPRFSPIELVDLNGTKNFGCPEISFGECRLIRKVTDGLLAIGNIKAVFFLSPDISWAHRDVRRKSAEVIVGDGRQ
jgi:hypothetical protein